MFVRAIVLVLSLHCHLGHHRSSSSLVASVIRFVNHWVTHTVIVIDLRSINMTNYLALIILFFMDRAEASLSVVRYIQLFGVAEV